MLSVYHEYSESVSMASQAKPERTTFTSVRSVDLRRCLTGRAHPNPSSMPGRLW
jgi:hypothetical protein